MTSFAYYVQNFFANIFTCCGGGNAVVKRDQDGNLRNSLNSSMHSNMLQYSFVAVPNQNSSSNDSGNGSGKQRRSKLIQDFKAAANQKDEKSILATGEDERDIDGESDIVDDEDHVANAQRPM